MARAWNRFACESEANRYKRGLFSCECFGRSVGLDRLSDFTPSILRAKRNVAFPGAEEVGFNECFVPGLVGKDSDFGENGVFVFIFQKGSQAACQKKRKRT